MSQPRYATAYFDSSALVKRYVTEDGTSWVQAWCNDARQLIAVAEIGLVEIAASFASKLRGGFITSDMYRDARSDLAFDARHRYLLVSVNHSVVDEAIELTGRYHLRGYDAVHLACALHLNRALVGGGLPSLTFVCADNELLFAAGAEGLATDNPTDHL